MFGLVLQLIVVAVIIQQGLVFLGKKKIKAERRREEIRRLVRLAKSEAAIVESERQRITDGACSVCYYAPTTIRCSCCKVTRYWGIIVSRLRPNIKKMNPGLLSHCWTFWDLLQDGWMKAKRELEEERDLMKLLNQELANTSKNVYATTQANLVENGWMKAMKELEEERELVKLMKMECDEIRQSFMSQVEKKEHELLSALNGAV